MGLNDTPSGERLHISFFGRRNAGKSSLVNAVTGQELSVVSRKKGTTTDPVQKAMELLPIGPVMIIDTPGYDDTGELGELRVRKTRQILNRTDLAVLVIDASEEQAIETPGSSASSNFSGSSDTTDLRNPIDQELLNLFREKEIPYLIVYNKADLLDFSQGLPKADLLGFSQGLPKADLLDFSQELPKADLSDISHGYPQERPDSIYVSALKQKGIYELKDRLAAMGKTSEKERFLVADLIEPSDLVLLVIPIDQSAPKGRLILPQQQVIRDILDRGGAALCVKEDELPAMLDKLVEPPALVVTDSQVFSKVAADIPAEIPLTSFSILMARYKGFLDQAVEGVRKIDKLKNGDQILIAEGCTHHRQCEDIGTVKIPNWLRQRTGKELKISTSSGRDFPDDLSPYSLIIHCGGCMLNEREIHYRMKCAKDQGVPITNYGTAIAYMKGILERSIEPLYRRNLQDAIPDPAGDCLPGRRNHP